jgi:hypothetical protein
MIILVTGSIQNAPGMEPPLSGVIAHMDIRLEAYGGVVL